MNLEIDYLWSHKCPKKWDQYTLIALVITIIVLLILAGVTIVTLTGDNGLITKASDARKENLKAEGLEKIKVEIAGSYDNNGQIDTNQLRTNLQHISGITTENDESITNNTEIKLPMLVKINGNQYLINLNGSTRAKYGIDEYDVASHPDTYYGCYVTNYNSPNDAGIQDAQGQLGKWQIFMADDTNIYLISSNCITRQYTGTKNNVGYDYDTENQTPATAIDMCFRSIKDQYNANSTTTDIPGILSRLDKQNIYHKWMNISANQIKNQSNEKSVASMLDVDLWNGYINRTYAKYAIGGPTIEMLCKSYNDSHTGDKLQSIESVYGYNIKKGDGAPDIGAEDLKVGAKNTLVDKMYFGKGFWIASPGGNQGDRVIEVRSTSIWNRWFASCDRKFCPLICLNSNVHLVLNEDGQTYSLELN